MIVSNGGVKSLKTRISQTYTTYLLTLNNWACEEGQKEDCWRAEVVDQLRQDGATVLNLPIKSHRDYVKTSIVQYIDACEGNVLRVYWLPNVDLKKSVRSTVPATVSLLSLTAQKTMRKSPVALNAVNKAEKASRVLEAHAVLMDLKERNIDLSYFD